MTAVVINWSDQSVTSPSTLTTWNNRQLKDQIEATGVTVNSWIWNSKENDGLNADTLYVGIDQIFTSGSKSLIDAAISNHVPIIYENRESVMYSGTTDINGELAITFDIDYRIEPEIFMEAVQDENHRNILISKDTSGCICKVVENAIVNAPLISLDVLTGPASGVQGAHITIDVRQRPENI